MVDDKARFCAGNFFDVLFFNIVDLDLFLTAPGGIVGGKARGVFKGSVGKLPALRADDDVGAGTSLGVEPPVVPDGEFKGQLFVLQVVFAYINGKSVAADIMEGAAGDLNLFGAALAADVAAFDQLFLDLDKILFL